MVLCFNFRGTKFHVMKTLLMALFCFAAAKIDAQIASGKLAGNDGAANKYYEFYDNSGNKIKNAGEEDVKGTPMFKEDWGSGVVKFKNGKEFKDSLMNFSLFENKLFFSKYNQIFIVSEPVEEFMITYKNEKGNFDKVHFKCGYPIVEKKDANTFYEVLYEGQGLQLLRWEQKKINESYSYGGAREREFSLMQQLYVYEVKENKMTDISSTVSSIKKSLPQCANYIDDYTAKHKLNSKDPQQLISLFAFLDEKTVATK